MREYIGRVSRVSQASIRSSLLILWFFGGVSIESDGGLVNQAIPNTSRDLKADTRQTQSLRIKPGELVVGQIGGGFLASYEVYLPSNTYTVASVEKEDLNILVIIIEPDGSKVTDFLSKRYGALRIPFISNEPGPHRIEIRSLEKSSIKGHFQVRIETLPDATVRDRQYYLAIKAFAEAERLRATWERELLQAAIKKYAQARELWQSTGYLGEAAVADQSAGEVYFILSEYSSALDSYNSALRMSQAIGDRRREVSVLNSIAYAFLALSNNQRSLEYSKQVLRYCAELQPSEQNKEYSRIRAEALNNMGEVYYLSPDIKAALECFNQALGIWSAASDRRGQALAHLNIGYAHTDSGNLQEALEHYKKALSLWSEVDDRRGTALSRTAIGGIYSFLGEKQLALDSHEQAMHFLHAIGDQQGEAATLNGIGKAYEDLNDPQKALESYNQALRLYQSIHNREFEALTKYYIGRVYRTTGDTRQALAHYNNSLSLSREVSNLRIQAYSLKDIASINSSEGRPLLALEQYNETLRLYRSISDRRGEAYTLNSIGDVYYTLGNTQLAINNYKQALDLCRASEDRSGEIAVLYSFARAERELGNAAEALSLISSSIGKIESLRSKVASQDLRVSYFASAHRHYDLSINLLATMHRVSPEKGFDAASFEASERYRARSMIEMLKEAKIDIRQGVEPVLLERERSLQHMLSAKAERQTRLLSGKHTKEQAQEMKEEIDALSDEYQKVEGEIRAKSFRYAALTQPEPFSLAKIQHEALDDDTLLLEYFLGDERSLLWAVTRDSITHYELPKRGDVERAARGFYELLTARNEIIKTEASEQRQERLERRAAEYPKVSAELSRMLLGPVIGLLGRKRLLIVADGALQYVPFAALPEQSETSKEASKEDREGTPLVVRHEIISVPSASTLVVMRREMTGRHPAPNLVAVLADPVFDSDDVRVRTRSKRSMPNRQSSAPVSISRIEATADAGTKDAQGGWPRLLFTRLEAEEIISIVRGKRSKLAMGFEASKKLATGPELGSYQIAHFATHGIIDSVHPELSGIVLSLVGPKGTSEDGFLRLHEIYNLRLPAELVVLSACQTGLGKEIRGEGLIGLTRGFMYAGTARVIASLWSVRDEATAELMKRFYTALIRRGKTPSAALQFAQASMWKDSDWKSPYYWAGFAIQGEWR